MNILYGNSSSTPLGANEVFTGTKVALKLGYVYINVYSDVVSAEDGLSIEQSADGENWDHCDEYTVPADGGKNYTINPHSLYFRVVYTNGNTPQTAFGIQCIEKATALASSHRLQDSIVDEDDVRLIKAVLSGKNPHEVYVNFQATSAGNFKISLEEANGEISDDKTGVITQLSFAHHEIHEGDAYQAHKEGTQNNSGVIQFMIQTPDTNKEFHILTPHRSSGESNFKILEGITYTSGGVAFVPVNKNRNSANTSDCEACLVGATGADPIVYSDGENIWEEHLGSGQTRGGESRENEEIILKRNTIYLFEFESESASNDLWMGAIWYEHTGLDL